MCFSINSDYYNRPPLLLICDLCDDVLIYSFRFMPVPDILRLRQTCKRFNPLTRLRIVWEYAFKLDILANNYPFDPDDTNLEHRTCHAYRLASRWLADKAMKPKSEIGFSGSPVKEVRFLPGFERKWLLTLSDETPSVLTIWDITLQKMCSNWSSNGAEITRMAINADPESEASVAVSLNSFRKRIVLLHLDNEGTLHEFRTINMTNMRPVTLIGDVMALSNDVSMTVIYNWKTAESASLSGSQLDHCFEVVLNPSTILLVRGTSINLYPRPPLLNGQTLTPVATYLINRAYSVSLPIPAPNNSPSILIRSHSHLSGNLIASAKLYSISLGSFPPILTNNIPYHCTALRCTPVILGKCATAVWIHTQEHDASETLVAAAFPGPLNRAANVRLRDVCTNTQNKEDNWIALDYDEEIGRIAFAADSGRIKILQL